MNDVIALSELVINIEDQTPEFVIEIMSVGPEGPEGPAGPPGTGSNVESLSNMDIEALTT